MASIIKEKAIKAASKLTSSTPTTTPSRPLASIQDAKYLLQVTAGPSYEASTHQPVLVNSSQPTAFENEHLKCHIKVRIRSYTGLPLHAPASSPYFAHESRHREQYSIGFSFVPKHDIDSDTAIWGNDFDHPVRDRLPPGFGIAVRIVKEFVDPSIEVDAYADQPWLFAPALSSFFAMRIGEKRSSAEEWGAPEELPDVEEEEPILEGADGSGAEVREQLGIPEQATKRRKFFRNAENRKKFKFEAGRLYQADFFNPYIDFANFSLKLPGFSINCIRYVNDKTHKLRYVFKNSKTDELYFCVVLTLLHGQDLQTAVKQEADRWAVAEAEAEAKEQQRSGSVSRASSVKSGLTRQTRASEESFAEVEAQRKARRSTEKPAPEVAKAYVEKKIGDLSLS